MTFNRYSDQCVNCACYFANADTETQELMDQTGIECSLEQTMFDKSICNFFQEAEE